MLATNLSDIGGGIVRRRFHMGGRDLMQGDPLTAEEIRAIPAGNRQALIENKFIEIYRGAGERHEERHVVHRGGNRYDVIEGRKLNDEPLSKEAAQALAGD